MKLILSFLSIVFFNSISFSQENNVDGLTIEFIKISEDYVHHPNAYNISYFTSPSHIVPLPHMASEIYATDGMKFIKIKIKFKNEGNKNCIFNLDDVYVSTEQDSLYRFYKYYRDEDNSVKIKPQKEVTKVVLVQFPDESMPKELFIEDKRYKIIVEEK